MDILAMEWGFRAHEKGMNLQMARREFQKLCAEQAQQPCAPPMSEEELEYHKRVGTIADKEEK